MKIVNNYYINRCTFGTRDFETIDKTELIARQQEDYLTLNPPTEDTQTLLDSLVYGVPVETADTTQCALEKMRLDFISEEARIKKEAELYGETIPQPRISPPFTDTEIPTNKLDIIV